MFKVIRKGQNRLDMELSGKLDSEEMNIALDEIESCSQDIENGCILYDVIEFHFPTLKAIILKFSRLPSMLGIIRKFRKAAVMSDIKWLKQASELEGLLIPGLEIKSFNRDELAEAEKWLAE